MAQPPLRTEWPFGPVKAARPAAVHDVRTAVRRTASPQVTPPQVTPPEGVARSGEATVVVGIADHEVLVRGGIRAALEQAHGIDVVADTGDAGSVIEMTLRHRLRVLLIDSGMAGTHGAWVTHTVRRLSPSTAVLVLASSPGGGHIDRILRAGVAGCLLKSGNPQDLVAAVRVVAGGGAVLYPEIAKHVLDRVARIDTERFERARELIGCLTLREREVLALVAQGMANSEIGRALHLSEGGVKAHISRLLTKLDCGNRVRAALIARDAGLTEGRTTEAGFPRPA
ncbi:LuxR C-terminal-related transcriptional regulator [Streptomyces sp. NPDC091280]|uniref:LuxR C-terminal-related transcriptional regulator n=1 Tax=Streptomyces sp. NPDC091280 TaxID=3365984 RepID=UPI00380C38FA